MEDYLPYIVSVVCALISGFTSYAIDKLELEHKHQLELQQKQFENQLGSDMMNTLISEAMKMPEVKKQISQGMNIAGNKKR